MIRGDMGNNAATFDLRSLFTIHGLLADTNNDQLPDRPNAVVVLGSDATPHEGVAAAHVAARLALESMGLDLPLVRTDVQLDDLPREVPLVVIGIHNRIYSQLGEHKEAIWADVESDQGLIQVLAADAGGHLIILVAGRTDVGTLNAANYLATAVQLQDRGSSQQAIIFRANDRQAAVNDGHPLTRIVVDDDRVLQDDRVLPRRDPAGRLSLASLYSLSGYLRDQDDDLFPEGTNLTVVLPAAGNADEWAAAANFAARIGLESTGITFPLAALDRALARHDDLSQAGALALFGRENLLTRQLIERGKLPLSGSVAAGQGVIRLVSDGFGGGDVLVVTGVDAAGELAAAKHLLTNCPFLSEVRRGKPVLADVENGIRDLLCAGSSAGQAVLAVRSAEEGIREIAGQKDLHAVSAEMFIEEANEQFAQYLGEAISQTIGNSALAPASVDVRMRSYKDGETIAARERSYGWEVDDFWALFTKKVVPNLSPEQPGVQIDLFLSESLEIRREVESQIRARLEQAGILSERNSIHVLSAYKQGYSWIEEVVVPQLKTLSVASVRIDFQKFDPDPSARWIDIPVTWLEQGKPPETRRMVDMHGAIRELEKEGYDKWLGFPIRWLQELFPIDEVIARELSLTTGDVTFAQADIPHTYQIQAFDADGDVIFTDNFDVHWVERRYLDIYPDWGKVHITTGWLCVEVGGKTLADERIMTDLEKFWDLYQEFLPTIAGYVLARTDGLPTRDKQPFFKEVLFDVSASEPNERVGIREEQFSTLEALHEDLYFVSLDFFSALGYRHVITSLQAPGQFIPLLHSTPRTGCHARIVLNAFAADGPKLVLTGTDRDGNTQCWEQTLTGVPEVDTNVTGILVDANSAVTCIEVTCSGLGHDGLQEVGGFLETLGRLHTAGVYRDALGWSELAEIRVLSREGGWDYRSITPRDQPRATEPEQIPEPAHDGELRVPLRHVISYEENKELLRYLGQFSEATLWLAGRSFQGRDIHALDLMLPTGTHLWSQTKASLFKPTYHINCRHHANEVSATNAALWLAELILTDPEYKQYLRHLNINLVSCENPDGAVLHYQLQNEHPYWMHHAARYNAAGLEFHSEYFNEDTIFPEARVRPLTWRTWLPDVSVDCHERPGHEWRQLFAGYTPVAWSYLWILPSLFTGILRYTDSPDYPQQVSFAEAMRAAVTAEINRDEEIRSWNLEWQDRYIKYAHSWMPDKSPIQYFEDVQFHLYGLEPNPNSWDLMQRNPKVTTVNWTTEVADETPQDGFLELCARATLTANRAVISFMANADYSIVRSRQTSAGGQIQLNLARPRPLVPRPVEA